MHWVNVAIILCIGNFIAWIIAMYVKDAVSGLIGHVLVSYPWCVHRMLCGPADFPQIRNPRNDPRSLR
jgi:hypothetical protein